jgi:hypothetical protein
MTNAMDDREKRTPLTLVADNSSATLEQQRAQQDLERHQSRAANAIQQLAINLLRIIAGAGEPSSLLRNIDDARTAYIDYLNVAKETGHPAVLLTRELALDQLFSREDREREPKTEKDGLAWAQPSDPYGEDLEDKARAKVELRRAALRQVALALSSGETEPHLKAHGGNLDDIIRSMLDAKRQLEQQRSLTPRQADPQRRAIAKRKISELQHEERTSQIKSLPAHQVAGLQAVAAGTVDQTDGFTLDVLGRMKLLTRPKGSKRKSAWELTEEGRMALEVHKNAIRS